jgi:hypothetical protein
MNRKSSLRFTEWPMPPISGDVFCSIFFSDHGILSAAYCTALTMFWYPVHRHRLPDIPHRISCSLGRGFLSRSAQADMIIPGVQNPH